MVKYSEFIRNLVVPTNLNIVHVKPLRGSALVIFEPTLVFMVVDSLFGGDGRFHTRIEGREFTPTEQQKDFQITTPHAIAAVRGTRWVVDVTPKQSSTLVLAGAVEVRRLRAAKGALLRVGEGADVGPANGPVVVKRWGKKRVDALLARFGT